MPPFSPIAVNIKIEGSERGREEERIKKIMVSELLKIKNVTSGQNTNAMPSIFSCSGMLLKNIKNIKCCLAASRL